MKMMLIYSISNEKSILIMQGNACERSDLSIFEESTSMKEL